MAARRSKPTKHVKVFYTGRVQGVGFLVIYEIPLGIFYAITLVLPQDTWSNMDVKLNSSFGMFAVPLIIGVFIALLLPIIQILSSTRRMQEEVAAARS